MPLRSAAGTVALGILAFTPTIAAATELSFDLDTNKTTIVRPLAADPVQSPQPSTAPLPSAVLAGPMTMAFAGWITWRIRRRGGRI